MQRGDRFAKIKEEITIKKERDVIQWHPAFCSATELEFLENRKNLEFHREVNLSRKPLQMDLLIIKKLADISLINEIGHIFRTISGNPRQFNYRDESTGVCISAQCK